MSETKELRIQMGNGYIWQVRLPQDAIDDIVCGILAARWTFVRMGEGEWQTIYLRTADIQSISVEDPQIRDSGAPRR